MPQSKTISRRLVRSFAIIGAIIMLLSAAAMVPIHYASEQRDITRSAERYNESLARVLALLVRNDISALLAVEGDGGRGNVIHQTIRTALNSAFTRLSADSKLLKVKLFDASAELIYSTDPDEIGVVRDDDHDEGFAHAYRDHAVSSDQTFRAQMQSIRGGVADRYVVASYVPLFHDLDPKQMIGLFEIYSDVTDRETAFHRALVTESLITLAIVGFGYAGLLCVISLGARDIEKAHQARLTLTAEVATLNAASDARTRLLMSMSHHLRTPLNAIIGFSDVIKNEKLGPIGDRRYAHYAGDVLESGHRLLRGVDNILDYVRVDSGKTQAILDVVSPPQTLQVAIQELAAFAQSASVTVICGEVSEKIGYLTTDSRHLRHILHHIVDNAIRYSRPGGHVWLDATAAADDSVIFTVADDGIGIPPADVASVFIPFGARESVLTQTQDGFGLGLPLSRRLADLLGGTLILKPRPAGGTIVMLTLPRGDLSFENAATSDAGQPKPDRAA